MGGAYRRGEGKQFFHVSSGSLKKSTGKKDEEGKPVYDNYDGYEGKLIAIEKFEDEFEKKIQKKIRLTMQAEIKDQKTKETIIETADITFTDETFFVVAFFSRLVNVEIDQPFLLGVLPSEQNTKMSFCFVKQFGKKVEKDKDFPQPEKIDLGDGKVAYKYKEVTARVDDLIAQIKDYLSTTNKEEEMPAEDDKKESF